MGIIIKIISTEEIIILFAVRLKMFDKSGKDDFENFLKVFQVVIVRV